MAECMAQACRCCECQGKHCLTWHPGHSHADGMLDPELTAITLRHLRAANEAIEKSAENLPPWPPPIEYGE